MSSVIKRRRDYLNVCYYLKDYFDMLNDMSNLMNLVDNTTSLDDLILNNKLKKCNTSIRLIKNDFYKCCSGYMNFSNTYLKNLTCSSCPEYLLDYNIIKTLNIILNNLALYIRTNVEKYDILYVNLLNSYTELDALIKNIK